MPLVSSSLPNLVGGVSQQPAALRLSSSAEEMENAWPSLVAGNQKRPASDFISKPGLTISSGVAGYIIDRDSTYRYKVILTNGDLKVLDLLTGAIQTVTFPDGKSYLAASSPSDSFRFVTIGDYTFICNRNIAVASQSYSETADRLDPAGRGYVYVTSSQYNTYYSVYVNGTIKASWLSPSGASGSSAAPDTATIAETLKGLLVASGYTVTRTGSTLIFTGLASTDTIQTQGATGDKSLKSFRDTVQAFSDLPVNAPEGSIIKVAGDVELAQDDYYVIYQKGVWVETYAYGSKKGFNPATMPHILVRNSDGTWTFKRHTWKDRLVGSTDSNKDPSFVGYKVNDIFVYQNRMGFLADENVILSEAGTYENFYRTSIAAILDSDRIDVAVLNTGVEILNSATPYNRDLLISSETAQFRVTYQNYLSAKTIQVKFTTAFNVSKRIKPINMGNSIYFVDDRPEYDFLKVWEYFPKDLAVSDDAEDVTTACPEYIKYNASFFNGSNRAKAAVLSTASAPSTLYFYKYFWSGDKKVQTAWCKWTFDDCVKIHWGGFAGTDFYMLIERSDGLNLEKIRFDEDIFDTDKNYHILLDRRTTNVTKTYDANTDKTTIVTPYSTTANLEIVSTEPGSPSTAVNGYRHSVTKVSGNTYTVYGDITTHTVTVGIPYVWLFTFSTFYVRQAKGSGEVPVLDGRLQIRYLALEYNNTAYFRTHVRNAGRDVVEYDFNANTVGSSDWQLGVQSFATGKYRIPVFGKNTDVEIWLTNDSPFPSSFGTAEWQGMYVARSSQRL